MYVAASAIGYVDCLQYALYRVRALRLVRTIVYDGTEEEGTAVF